MVKVMIMQIKAPKKKPMLCSSIWRSQMIASQLNKQSRAYCEEYFDKLKQLVEMEVGSIYYEDDGQGKGLDSSKNVLNPLGSRKKWVCLNAVQQGVLSQQEDATAMPQQEMISSTSYSPSYFVDPRSACPAVMSVMVQPYFPYFIPMGGQFSQFLANAEPMDRE
ncbi:hypothetical protein Cgig2_027992 [Carnegiea gigantea]|uniref:Uncharacterized protein n=1 Tax=Carnegiea gigantea TaxID=171969 RepID=A0A9Q1JMB7_9CARY|nr:hypothetical protein Cgig2_027992 [Carnegiea gigantea]